ncbi:hypothetical protein CB1_001095012 [Camelus ferus]|nr:hypothetical protein CB1_001095012 [Camelus ferus]
MVLTAKAACRERYLAAHQEGPEKQMNFCRDQMKCLTTQQHTASVSLAPYLFPGFWKHHLRNGALPLSSIPSLTIPFVYHKKEQSRAFNESQQASFGPLPGTRQVPWPTVPYSGFRFLHSTARIMFRLPGTSKYGATKAPWVHSVLSAHTLSAPI